VGSCGAAVGTGPGCQAVGGAGSGPVGSAGGKRLGEAAAGEVLGPPEGDPVGVLGWVRALDGGVLEQVAGQVVHGHFTISADPLADVALGRI
jgi:hypothetical protein